MIAAQDDDRAGVVPTDAREQRLQTTVSVADITKISGRGVGGSLLIYLAVAFPASQGVEQIREMRHHEMGVDEFWPTVVVVRLRRHGSKELLIRGGIFHVILNDEMPYPQVSDDEGIPMSFQPLSHRSCRDKPRFQG